MSVGPIKSLATGFTALGLMATGPLTGNAYAQEARPIQINSTTTQPAIVQAGNFGQADSNNVGIMIYYGSGNEPTPDQVGNFIVGKLESAASASGQTVNADYFWVNAPNMEGIVVTFHMGGLSMDNYDIRDAIAPDTLSRVVQRRDDINKTIDMAALP